MKKPHDPAYTRVEGCIFCEMPSDRVDHRGNAVFAIRDKYPVTAGHTLVIPHRHVSKAMNLDDVEFLETMTVARKITSNLMAEDGSISGFNFGYNQSKVAGQTVDHAHFHIIPRRDGDVEDPIGGIRGVIPDKRRY